MGSFVRKAEVGRMRRLGIVEWKRRILGRRTASDWLVQFSKRSSNTPLFTDLEFCVGISDREIKQMI